MLREMRLLCDDLKLPLRRQPEVTADDQDELLGVAVLEREDDILQTVVIGDESLLS